MDQGPETEQSVLQSWIGNQVELHYMASSAEVTPHGVIAGPAETRVGTYLLVAVDDKGIEAVIPDQEEKSTIYVPWHSVLLIQGLSREDLESDESEQNEVASEQAKVASVQHDRQDLMNRLANAGTPTEVAIARAMADSWLASNPSDGDVRMARDQLLDTYPAGD